jgi:hypothetical protein
MDNGLNTLMSASSASTTGVAIFNDARTYEISQYEFAKKKHFQGVLCNVAADDYQLGTHRGVKGA